MVVCIVALVVFAFLGIFSAKYRTYTKEAFHCITRKLTLRPCDTNFDQKIRSKTAGKLLRVSPALAKFTYKYFEGISWAFIIIFVVTSAYLAYSGYNYYVYGSCYGPESGGFCPYAAFEETYSGQGSSYTGPVIYPDTGNASVFGPENSSVIIIEFGCYMCPYTKKADPVVKEILQKYEGKVRYVFRNFPIHRHNDSELHAEAALCAREQGKFWEYHDKLFAEQDSCKNMTHEDMLNMFRDDAISLGLNATQFEECLVSGKYKAEIESDMQAGIMAGVSGTPAFFINNRTIFGNKPIATFNYIIDDELRKAE